MMLCECCLQDIALLTMTLRNVQMFDVIVNISRLARLARDEHLPRRARRLLFRV